MNKLGISNLRRMFVCIALLAYGMQSFAFAGGLMMGMPMSMSTSEPVVIDVSESTMPGCHMNTMVFNDDSATITRDISAAAVTPNCCAGDLCENSCSMANCSSVTALVSTISLPWFVIVKPSSYTFEAMSLVYYPRSFSRPPIFS